MDFSFNEDQIMMQDSAKNFFQKECSAEFVREMYEDNVGYSEEMWNKMAELGWMGIMIPEEYGGLGLTFLDLALIMEEMGRFAVPIPFFSTVILGAEPIKLAGSNAMKEEILSKIAVGELRMSLALMEEEGNFLPSGINLSAKTDGDGYILNGMKLFVPDAHAADKIIVAARTGNNENDITLFLVDKSDTGLSVELQHTMDGSRKLSAITLDNVRISKENIIGEVNKGWPILDKVLNMANAALCLETLGAAQKALEMTVEYVKIRIQYEVPIGSFQSVKHRLADAMLQVESARSAAYYAAWAVSEDDKDMPLAVSLAKTYCVQAGKFATNEGVQLHGAIGYTWEHDMHLFFKRVRFAEAMFGGPIFHKEKIATLIGL